MKKLIFHIVVIIVVLPSFVYGGMSGIDIADLPAELSIAQKITLLEKNEVKTDPEALLTHLRWGGLYYKKYSAYTRYVIRENMIISSPQVHIKSGMNWLVFVLLSLTCLLFTSCPIAVRPFSLKKYLSVIGIYLLVFAAAFAISPLESSYIEGVCLLYGILVMTVKYFNIDNSSAYLADSRFIYVHSLFYGCVAGLLESLWSFCLGDVVAVPVVCWILIPVLLVIVVWRIFAHDAITLKLWNNEK